MDYVVVNHKMVDVNKAYFKNLNLFESLCDKINGLVYSRSGGEKKALSRILDDLNDLDYNLFCVKNDRGVLLINHCCLLIASDEVSLTLKATSLFINLITKGQITVEGKTLSFVVCWCLERLKFGNHLSILKCLQALVKGSGKKIESHCLQIIREVKKISNDFTFAPDSEELCLNSLRCIEAITFPSGEDLSPDITLNCFEILRDVLFRENCNVTGNEIISCKFLITAMRGIGNLIQMQNEIINTDLDSILGIVKGYMLFGLPGYDKYEVQKVFPSSTTVPEVLKSSQDQVKKLRGKYDRRSKKVAMTSINSVEESCEVGDVPNGYIGFSENARQEEPSFMSYKTSDSEFSDGEFIQSTKLKSCEGRVRHCALILLGTVIQKTDRKTFIAYMPSFLPDSSQVSHVRTLTTCLLKEPSAKCRCEVLGVLLLIIFNCRQYFLQADGISKSSFIAFSCTISNIIRELQRCLLLSLVSEKNVTAITRTLKCISDLIRCTPYHKMESGLITNIAKQVKNFLEHKDVNVQIFALTVFGCLVSIEPKVQEVRDIIINPLTNEEKVSNNSKSSGVDSSNGDDEVYEITEEVEEDEDTVKEKPWLFEHCLKNLSEKTFSDLSTNSALQVESLQVVGALIRNFFKETVVSFPSEIIKLLKRCSTKSEYSVRLYSGKLMATVLNSIQFSFSHEDESKRPSFPLVNMFWDSLLPGPVTALIQSYDEPMLRSTGCDCIASIGIQGKHDGRKTVQNGLIFDQLPRDRQILCITLLFGCIKDGSPAVRSSAARAMAIFALFDSLREDSLFFLDAIDATLVGAKDENITVRTQASWLLGNLTEAIVLNKETNIDDGVTLEYLVQLLQTGIKLSSDRPKVKPGAVRGIGSILQIANEDFLKCHKDVIFEGINALMKCATSGTFMKARWNSCYAIANALQNPLVHGNHDWTAKMFKVLMNLVQHYKNFKVRISAGFALGILPTRESYGDLYKDVWSAVLNGLENSKNIPDFNEYQHRDHLVDQLCLVLCHLVSLITPEDLYPLQGLLYFHSDNLTHFMGKFQERIVPEKSDGLLNAKFKIHSLLDEKGLTMDDKSVLKVLETLFANEN